MMKKVSFMILLLVLLAGLVWQQSPTETAQSLPTLPTIQASEVASFEIQRHQETLLYAELVAKDWLLVNDEVQAKLKGNNVEQLLFDVQNMRAKRVASHKAEHHARFSVAEDDTKLILRNHNGERMLSILIGKPATDLMSTYIRLQGEDIVITVDKILTWQVNRTQDAWLSKEESPE
jgi:hypothetical protein